MIKEFAAHHMKTEQIKIDQELSHAVWARGIRSPPRKIRVKMTKTDDGYVMVFPYEEDVQPKEEKTKEEKKSDTKSESKEKKDDKEAAPEAPAKEEKKSTAKEEKKPAAKEAKKPKAEEKKPAKKSK